MFGVLSMRWQVYLMVSIILLLLCETVGAELIPDASLTTISPSTPPWVVANGVDSILFSVTVRNSSNISIPNLNVVFSLNNSNFGTLNPINVITGGNGIANTTFRSGIVSGTAEIIATIHYSESGINKTLNKSGIVLIDHDTPYSFKHLLYPYNASVGSTWPIIVGFQDSHGNAVDNRRYTEKVNLSIVTIGDTTRFWNASQSSFSDIACSIPVDSLIRRADKVYKIVPNAF